MQIEVRSGEFLGLLKKWALCPSFNIYARVTSILDNQIFL